MSDNSLYPPRPLDRVFSALGALVAMALLSIVIATPLPLMEQAVLGGLLLLFAIILGRFDGPATRMFLVFLSLGISSRYFYWRVTETLSFERLPDAIAGYALFAAEAYAGIMLIFGYLQSAAVLPRLPARLPPDPSAWPTVDIYIPTYNEPLDVVRATVLAAKNLDWPAEKLAIYILDDGRREPFRAFAEEAGVGYIIRPDNKHAKAGNLNHAMMKTTGELIAIFDCDHIPVRSFLQTTVGWFLRERRLAMLQTPHHFYSPDPFERNLNVFKRMPNEGELFYGVIQPANDLWNGVFFCGSCAVLRRTALQEVGGVAVETVTEDAHTALKMHRRGWSTAFINIAQAGGLATESLSAHVGQRIRWARGMVQIFRLDNPFLGRGLRFLQRLSYAASMLHFLGGIPRIVFLVAPLGYLLFGLHVFNALPVLALVYWLPHIALALFTNSKLQGKRRFSFWSEVYETALAFYIAVPTAVALISPKHGKFNVTAKGGTVESAAFDSKIARPNLVLALLCIVGLAAGAFRLWKGIGEPSVALLNLFWTCHNLTILLAALSVAWEQRQVRRFPRVDAALPMMLRAPDGKTFRGTTSDLSLGGMCARMAKNPEIPAGSPVEISIFAGFEEVPLPATLCSHPTERMARFAFQPLTVAQEQALVDAAFSRADAWTSWGTRRIDDHPLRELAAIGKHAFSGVWRLVRSWNPPEMAAPQPEPIPAFDGRSRA